MQGAAYLKGGYDMIIAIRHPRPALASGICYGQLDVGLAEPAEDSARDILQGIGSIAANVVISSPLRRSREVAELLAKGFGLPLAFDARLQEMNFGDWEGRDWASIPRQDLDAWARDVGGYRPGGGETVDDLMQRVTAVWEEAVASGEAQVWVTHAGPIRCLMALSRAGPLEDVLQREVPYATPLRFALPTQAPGSTMRYAPRR